MAFKTDDSFLEKISIGAIGTIKVFDNLRHQRHTPIELERGSMNFKIWKEIKIKRVRVPDILCVDCGKRIESRAKTKLSITMSHSLANPERGWDFGLDNKDFIAFVKCIKFGESPIDWKTSELVQYISVKLLRKAVKDKNVIWEKPKGAEEGFEARITWPCAVASCNAKIVEIAKQHVRLKREHDDRLIRLSLLKKNIKLKPLIKAGDIVYQDQIIAGVVPVTEKFTCPKGMDIQAYVKLLKSASLSDRYGASKALSHFKDGEVKVVLLNKMNDGREHIYIFA